MGGAFSVTITVTDVAGASVSQIYTLSLTAAPAGTISSVTLANTGGTAGRIVPGDTITVVFSSQMSVSSLCSTWSNDANNQSLTANGDVVVTVTDGTGVTNDSLSVNSGTCTFNFGSVGLGSNAYLTGGAVTFSGNGANASKINWTAGSNTLTITLGSKHGSGTMATVASSAPTYTAGPITTSLGGTLSNSPFALGNGQQF